MRITTSLSRSMNMISLLSLNLSVPLSPKGGLMVSPTPPITVISDEVCSQLRKLRAKMAHSPDGVLPFSLKGDLLQYAHFQFHISILGLHKNSFAWFTVKNTDPVCSTSIQPLSLIGSFGSKSLVSFLEACWVAAQSESCEVTADENPTFPALLKDKSLPTGGRLLFQMVWWKPLNFKY